MKFEINSPITSYVNTTLKLDGYFNEKIHDTRRLDKHDSELNKTLTVHKKEYLKPTLDSYLDGEVKNKSGEDYVKSKLERSYHNLQINETKDCVSFKQFRKYCPHCYSKNVVEDSYYPKKIVLDSFGKTLCHVKRYHCKDCEKDFSADISSIVDKNCSISRRVMNIVRILYAVGGMSIYRIQEILEINHNVSLSHQEIQNIIIKFNDLNSENIKKYSGYHVFDSLWVKIDEYGDKYVYLLALFDAEYRTLIANKIVEHETPKEVYTFLEEATHAQPRIAITSDLKGTYKKPIRDLGFKHQYCEFHTKKNHK